MELTKAEEQIMHILWKIEKGFVKDILELIEEPKPAYTTVATIVRILEKKGFVAFNAYGNAHQYYPLILKEEYSKTHVNSVFKRYFKGSVKDLVSFFAKNNEMQVQDIDAAIKLLSEIKKKEA